MEIKQTIHLYAPDSHLFFHTRRGDKRTLFGLAMRKLAILHSLAKRRRVYALLKLLEIKSLLNQTLQEILRQTKSIKRVLGQKVGQNAIFNTPILIEMEFGFSFPLAFELIVLLRKIDECFLQLHIARNSGCFRDGQDYYFVKERLIKNVQYTLSFIVRIDVREIPSVTIEHYLEDAVAYQRAVEKRGTVNPQVLYTAMQSDATPTFTESYMQEIAARLREKSQSQQMV